MNDMARFLARPPDEPAAPPRRWDNPIGFDDHGAAFLADDDEKGSR